MPSKLPIANVRNQMIDYDKLRLAHELTVKLSTHYITHTITPKHGHMFELCSWGQIENIVCASLDELIEKLTEINQRTPAKFKINDEVFCFLRDEIMQMRIEEVMLKTPFQERCYRTNLGFAPESRLHSSREALIEAQILHWQKLLHESCEHDFVKFARYLDDNHVIYFRVCNNCKLEVHAPLRITEGGMAWSTPPFEGEIKGFKRDYTGSDSCETSSSEKSKPCAHEKDCSIQSSYNIHSDGQISHVKFKCKHCGELYK